MTAVNCLVNMGHLLLFKIMYCAPTQINSGIMAAHQVQMDGAGHLFFAKDGLPQTIILQFILLLYSIININNGRSIDGALQSIINIKLFPNG